MTKIDSVETLRTYLIGIMDVIDRFCRANGILYSLGSGTMLGAVRHGGFIPWDDDVDLLMWRDEYEKLIAKAAEQGYLLENRYRVMLPGDAGYTYPFIKVVDTHTVVYEKNARPEYAIGLYVDIFPLDYAYDDDRRNWWLVLKQRGYVNKMLMFCHNDSAAPLYRLYCRCDNAFLSLFGCDADYWIRRCNAFPRLPRSGHCGLIAYPSNEREIFPVEYFDGYTEMGFEGKMYLCFARYDDILTRQYGDYMTPVPEKKRVGHQFAAYIKDEWEETE